MCCFTWGRDHGALAGRAQALRSHCEAGAGVGGRCGTAEACVPQASDRREDGHFQGGITRELGRWMVRELRDMGVRGIAKDAFAQGLTADPFPPQATERIIRKTKAALRSGGYDYEPRRGDAPQEFECRML